MPIIIDFICIAATELSIDPTSRDSAKWSFLSRKCSTSSRKSIASLNILTSGLVWVDGKLYELLHSHPGHHGCSATNQVVTAIILEILKISLSCLHRCMGTDYWLDIAHQTHILQCQRQKCHSSPLERIIDCTDEKGITFVILANLIHHNFNTKLHFQHPIIPAAHQE